MRRLSLLLAVGVAVIAAGCGESTGDASKPVEPGTATAPGGPSGAGPGANSQTATPGS